MAREFSRTEWLRLSEPERESAVDSWDPQRPSLGEETRGEILEAFGAAFPAVFDGGAAAYTAFFGNAGWSIAVVSLARLSGLPSEFAGLAVVQGITRNPDDPLSDVVWLALGR